MLFLFREIQEMPGRRRRKKLLWPMLTLVFVLSMLSGISVSADSSEIHSPITMKVGAKRQLQSVGGSAPYRWSSSDSSIARVTATGYDPYASVEARSVGKCTITLVSDKLVTTLQGGTIETYTETWEITVVSDSDDSGSTGGSGSSGTGNTVRPTVQSVKLSRSSATLTIGNTLSLRATLSPSGASSTLAWSSTNTSVAMVSTSGRVTAVKAGTATITVRTANGKTASCKITVKKPAVKRVAFSESKVTLYKGGRSTLKAVISPSGASGKITYKSSKPSVVKVSSKGVIRGLKTGKATITATVSGKKAVCRVTVLAKPTSVKLSKTKVSLRQGKSLKLKYMLKPSKAYNKVTWYSSNPRVATVSDTGKVQGVSMGSCTIRVKTAGGKKASCKVTVTAPAPTSISLSQTSVTLAKGGKTTLTYSLSPAKAEGRIKWSTSNASVAKVNSRGKVTAVSAGTAKITARFSSSVSAVCTVRVPASSAATSITLSETPLSIKVGESLKVTAALKPSYTLDKVTWTSSDKTVASVSSDGTVRGVSEGRATITASAGNATKRFELWVSNGGVYDLSKGAITVNAGEVKQRGISYPRSGRVVIIQSGASAAGHLTVNSGTVALAGIWMSGNDRYNIYVGGAGDVTLELMEGTENYIGNGSIRYLGASSGHTLTIQGTGSLEVHASSGTSAISGHNIVIREGNLDLYVSNSTVPVIGDYTYSNITILSGAKIRAHGGYQAVGGGSAGYASKTPTNISIAEGSVIYSK